MIRLFLILVCYLTYGNFSYAFDNLLIFSLINIAFYSFLKEKKINLSDFIIFILATYMIELFLGLQLFISVVALSIPLLVLSYVINNYSIHYSIISLLIFGLSLVTFHLLYPDFLIFINVKDYLLYFLVFIFLNISLRLDGKE